MNPEEKKNDDFSFSDIPVLGGGGKQDKFSFDSLLGNPPEHDENSNSKTPEDSSLALFEKMLADSPMPGNDRDDNEVADFSDEEINRTNPGKANTKKLCFSEIFAQGRGKINKMLLIGGAVGALVFITLIGVLIVFVFRKKDEPPPSQTAHSQPAQQTATPGSGGAVTTTRPLPQPPPNVVTGNGDEIKTRDEYILKIELLNASGKLDEAGALIEKFKKKFPDISSLREAIRLTPKLNDKIRITRDAVSALKVGPEKSKCNLLLAELLLRDGKKKDVEAIIAGTDPASFPTDLCLTYMKILVSLSMDEKIKADLPAILEKNYGNLDFSRTVQEMLRGIADEEFKTEIFKSVYDKHKDAASEYLYGRALGNSPAAKIYFQEAIKENPLFDSAWFEMGKCFMQERNWNSAVESFSKTAEINKLNMAARFMLDLSRLYKGDGEPAVKDYENYLRERNAMGEKGMMELLSLAQRLDNPKLSEEYLKMILANPKLKKQHMFAEVKNKFRYGSLSDADFINGFPGQARQIYILYLLSKNREDEVLNLITPPGDFPDFWKVFLCWKKNVPGWKQNAELLAEKNRKSGQQAIEMIASLWLDKLSADAFREFASKIPYEDEPIFYWMLAEKYLKDGNKTKAKVCFTSALNDSRNILNRVIKKYVGSAQ